MVEYEVKICAAETLWSVLPIIIRPFVGPLKLRAAKLETMSTVNVLINGGGGRRRLTEGVVFEIKVSQSGGSLENVAACQIGE